MIPRWLQLEAARVLQKAKLEQLRDVGHELEERGGEVTPRELARTAARAIGQTQQVQGFVKRAAEDFAAFREAFDEMKQRK